MLGVLSRLAVYNGFDRLECRRLFGHAGMASFRSSAKCDPNVPAAIDLERLITMTGWTSPLLDASFSPYYDWPLTITCRSECESVQRRSDRSDRLAHKLRVCLTCARYGEHLLFHQMIDWQRCPLHLDQLTEECPVCRRLFGHYAYSLDATALVRCRGCGWQPPSASRASTARQMTRRLRIMADYDDWLYRIHAAGIDGDWRQRLFLGPRPARALAGVHRLIPGPAWVEHCLDGVDRVSLVSYERRGSVCRPSVLASTQSLAELIERPVQTGVHLGGHRRGELVARVQFRVAKYVETLVEETTRDVRLTDSRLILITTRQRGRNYAVVNETKSIAMVAFWLWCEHIRELRADHGRLRPLASNVCPGLFMPLWLRGPGTLFRTTQIHSNRWSNRAVGLWVSELWYEQVLRDLLCMFTRLVEAARLESHTKETSTVAVEGPYRRSQAIQLPETGRGLIDIDMSPSLVFDTGDFPVFLLESAADKVVFKIATFSNSSGNCVAGAADPGFEGVAGV